MAPSSAPKPDSRYHHFVPQFILRNFSHPYQPASTGKKCRKSKSGLYPGDEAVNGIDLSSPNVKIVETKVSRTFGIQDMYIDAGHATNKQHIEEMFSKLENDAAVVISKIRKTFEGGEKIVALTRGERNVVRKFLFVMKYRKPSTHDRFFFETPEEYIGDDKEIFLEYMRRKGFKKPIEVWLDNIKAFLEIKMDVGTAWEKELGEKAYPLDAVWFVMQTSMFYMSFCTPSDLDNEFIMTENGYGIHEGPVSISTDRETAEVEVECHIEYHTFAHISPKLTIILRAFMLPLAVEDGDPEVREMREKYMELNLSLHNDQVSARSFLQDLPITKPMNSYSTIVHGRAVSLTGKEHVHSQKDVFYFRFFPLSVEHVAKINTIFLEEAYPTGIIAFNNKSSVRRAVEYYLGFDDEDGGKDNGFKLTSGRDDDPRLLYLKKLEQAVKLLGGDAKAIYKTKDLNGEPKKRKKVVVRDKVFDMIKASPKATGIYTILCEKRELDPDDFEQARIMLTLRIKIDTWTKGLDESFREQVRGDLRDYYCQLPAHRLWIYLKRVRFMFNDGTILNPFGMIQDSRLPEQLLFGPEDAVAKGRDVILPTQIRRIMYYATINHLRINDPNFGLKGPLAMDDEGILALKQDVALAFGTQGSICDCGIPHIEALAVGLHNHFVVNGVPNFGELTQFFNIILTPEEQIEMATRAYLKIELNDLSKSSDDEMKELFSVLLGVVFPTMST